MIVKYVQPVAILWDESGLEGTEARGGKRGVRCVRQPMVACLRIALSMMITEIDTGKRSRHLLNYSVLVFVVYSLFDLSLFGSCSIFLIGSDFAFRLLSLSLFAEEYVFLFYLFPSIILTSM